MRLRTFTKDKLEIYKNRSEANYIGSNEAGDKLHGITAKYPLCFKHPSSQHYRIVKKG